MIPVVYQSYYPSMLNSFDIKCHFFSSVKHQSSIIILDYFQYRAPAADSASAVLILFLCLLIILCFAYYIARWSLAGVETGNSCWQSRIQDPRLSRLKKKNNLSDMLPGFEIICLGWSVVWSVSLISAVHKGMLCLFLWTFFTEAIAPAILR